MVQKWGLAGIVIVDGRPLVGIAQERVGALGGVDTLAVPDGVDDLLAGGALDEGLCLAHDGHLDGVADAGLVIKIVEFVGAPLEDVWWGAFEDGPGGDEDAGELEDVGPLAEGAGGEDFAEGGAGAAERGGGEVLVADKVDAVEEEAEYRRSVLELCVFLFERSGRRGAREGGGVRG